MILFYSCASSTIRTKHKNFMASCSLSKVSGHGHAVMRTGIAAQPRVSESLEKLLELENTLQLRLKYQNLKFRNYALRRIETIWNSGPIYRCWFPYVAIDLFDCLPPLVDEDVDLVVVSCLTLACKMQKKRFYTTAFMLERGLTYTLEEVVQMELHILRLMERNTRQLTPLCFVDHLAHHLPSSCNIRHVYRIIMWTQANMKFSQISPSTIASSAILCSTLSEDHKMTIMKAVGVTRMETINICINLMETEYEMKLINLRAEASNISEDNIFNISVEWTDQIVIQTTQERAGLFQRTLGCIRNLFECFQADQSTETSTLNEPLLPTN